MLTLGLGTTLRQRFRPKYYPRQCLSLRLLLVGLRLFHLLVKQLPVTCVLDPPDKEAFYKALKGQISLANELVTIFP